MVQHRVIGSWKERESVLGKLYDGLWGSYMGGWGLGLMGGVQVGRWVICDR